MEKYERLEIEVIDFSGDNIWTDVVNESLTKGYDAALEDSE